MAQQTALQLLLLKLVDLEIGKYLPSDVLNELQKAYFEAKEKFQQQIETAYDKGIEQESNFYFGNDYYTETYKSQ
jgi:hypothetical protein